MFVPFFDEGKEAPRGLQRFALKYGISKFIRSSGVDTHWHIRKNVKEMGL